MPILSRLPTTTWALPVLALAALAACGAPEDTDVPTTTFRDSAGVTVVENPASAVAPLPWTLGDAPILEIGALEGPETHQLFRVTDALRLPDGRLAVANAGTSEVRIFGPDGSHLATLGGEGDGPGELRFPQRLLRWAGDTLGVWDLRHRRITLFGTDGEAGRTLSFQSLPGMPGPGYAGMLEDGGIVVTGTDLPPPSELGNGEEIVRPPMAAAIVAHGGEMRASLGTLPGREAVIRASGSSVNILGLPFNREAVATGFGDRVVFTTNDRWEIRLHAGDGTLERLVRVDLPVRPLTEAHRADQVEASVSRAPEEARPGLRAWMEEAPVPDSLPAFDAIVPGGDGNLWVREFRLDTEEGPERWLVFDPEGRLLGTVETPAGLTVHQVGADFLLATATDELGVERVQLWPLERP